MSIFMPFLVIIDKKKLTCWVDFAVSTDHKMKIKENEKNDKFLDLAGELRRLRCMKVMLISNIIDAHETVPKAW